MNKKDNSIYVMKDEAENILGKINIFDYNPRNKSVEFGYYLPRTNRKQGLGKIMIKLFLQIAFNDKKLDLNKLYATTASNNLASIKVLEYLNFKLDGKLREHYWINNEKYDQLHYSLLRKEYVSAIKNTRPLENILIMSFLKEN